MSPSPSPTEIIRIQGTREEKIAAAGKIKDNLERYLPEMAELRRQLIEAGMCKDNLTSVARVKTPEIDYLVTRDDPDRYARRHAEPPYIDEEVQHALQDRARNQAIAANRLRDGGRGSRRRPGSIPR